MLGIFVSRPGRASEGVTMEGSAPPSKSRMLAIIPRLVVDVVVVAAKLEDAAVVAAEVVRGTKAAAEEAAARTPSRTGREETIFMVVVGALLRVLWVKEWMDERTLTRVNTRTNARQ